MKKKNKLQIAGIIIYSIIFLAFFIFSIYMSLAEHNTIYRSRKIEKYEIVSNFKEKTVKDENAPIGIRKEYRWKLNGITTTKDYLAFYTVYQSADAYINGELVYSLHPDKDNKIATSTSSNWIFIPLELSDNGKDIEVIITPSFNGVKDREPEFLLGARSGITLKMIRTDLPQIIISGICILIGLILMIIEPNLVILKKTNSWQMFYLGCFLMLIGTWRITDTRSSPIMFYKAASSLGYISVAALFIIFAPLLLILQENFTGRKKTVISLNLLFVCFIALTALICQITGITELREILKLSHISIIVSIATVFILFLIPSRSKSNTVKLTKLFIPLLIGALADFISYYINKNSSELIFTSLALLLYTVVKFINQVLKMNKKASTDELTDLLNRSKWNEFANNSLLADKSIGIIMLDINGLKYVNDTIGHKTGDIMIKDFAKILLKVMPANCKIFRWGGDEFTVLINDASKFKTEALISKIISEVDIYNLTSEKPEIHFAFGYALSAESPNLSFDELMKKADDQMYRNKNEYYSNSPHKYKP